MMMMVMMMNSISNDICILSYVDFTVLLTMITVVFILFILFGSVTSTLLSRSKCLHIHYCIVYVLLFCTN